MEKEQKVEKKEENVVSIPEPIEMRQPKRKVTVRIVRDKDMIVSDENGNGITIPKTKKHQNLKSGDIISI